MFQRISRSKTRVFFNKIEGISNNLDMNDEYFSLSIKYADDSTLLTLDFKKLQTTTYELKQAFIKWVMKINFDKCKNLILSVDSILIQGEHIQNVSKFVHHGTSIPNFKNDIKRRTDLALSFFGRLRKSIWSNNRTSILLIATYTSETWALTASDETKLFVFEMQCPNQYLEYLNLTELETLKSEDHLVLRKL